VDENDLMLTQGLTFRGAFVGVSKPDLMIGSDIALRLLRVAVLVPVTGTTLRTNLIISGGLIGQ
jgi:hypothetical protein